MEVMLRTNQQKAAQQYGSVSRRAGAQEPEAHREPSYYEQLSEIIAKSIQEQPEEAFAAAVPKPRITEVTTEMEAHLNELRQQVLPLAKQYITLLELDPENEEGRMRLESTVQFYGRNQNMVGKLRDLVQSLS